MDDRKIIASISHESGLSQEEIKKTLKAYFKALKIDLNAGMTISIEDFGDISQRKLPGRILYKKRSEMTSSHSKSIVISEADESIKYASHTGNEYPESLYIQDYHFDIIDEIYNINTKKILSELISDIGIEQKVLSEKVFDITTNTLRAYRQEKNKELPPRLKELAMSIQELYTKGKEIFLNIENFNIWLNKEQIGLEGRKPIVLINTIAGIHMVIEELLRIEFGATA